jgi:hypothetical protein
VRPQRYRAIVFLTTPKVHKPDHIYNVLNPRSLASRVSGSEMRLYRDTRVYQSELFARVTIAAGSSLRTDLHSLLHVRHEARATRRRA